MIIIKMKRRIVKMSREIVREYIKFFKDNSNNWRELETAFTIYTLFEETDKVQDDMIDKIDKEVRRKSLIDEEIRDNIEEMLEVDKNDKDMEEEREQ